ncbi:MAG: N-acetylmuramoyl-L-alanine amidase [Candidatus Sericytochromatia bacterium]|nr:N-acetylmuramoyl-L-alanine amidase [Candidatus Sericytochromatia bacterium]
MRWRWWPGVVLLVGLTSSPAVAALPRVSQGERPGPVVLERQDELVVEGVTAGVRRRFRLTNPDREVLDLTGLTPPLAYFMTRVWKDASGRTLLRSGWEPALQRWRFVWPIGIEGGCVVEEHGSKLVFRGIRADEAPVAVRSSVVQPSPPPLRNAAPSQVSKAVPVPTWGPLLPLWKPDARRAGAGRTPPPSAPPPPVRSVVSPVRPLPAARAAVAAEIPKELLPPLPRAAASSLRAKGAVPLGPFLPTMVQGPPVPENLRRAVVLAGPRTRAARITHPSPRSSPASARWEVVRHGTEDEGEPDVVAQIPWPREVQRIERFSLRKHRQETIFEVLAARGLTVWPEVQPQSARWVLRFPRAKIPAPPPRPRGVMRRLTLARDAHSWFLTMDLDPGHYDVVETRINDGRGLQLRFRRRKLPVPGRPVIVLDPGHGGADPGAKGPDGVTESQVTLDVANRLRPLLEHAGFHVVPTRTTDAAVRLGDRATFAESLGASALVSIHCNSSSLREAQGIETWFRHESGAALARQVHEALVRTTGRSDRGVRQGKLMVLKGPALPGVLVEMGFLSHPEESARLLDEDHQAKVAEGIARGLRSLAEVGRMTEESGKRLQDQRGAEPKIGTLGAPKQATQRSRGEVQPEEPKVKS